MSSIQKKDPWSRLVISSNKDYGGCLQIHYHNGYKKLPTDEHVFDCNIAVVSSMLITSKNIKNGEDEVTWSDFEFGLC